MSGLATTAIVRPDSWNLPFFVHVLAAMVMVGLMVLALVYLAAAWREDSAASMRAAYRTLLIGVIPSFLVMRISAQWLYDEEGFGGGGEEPTWIVVGFASTDIGALLLVAATVTAGLAARRARPSDPAGPESAIGAGSVRTVTAIVSFLLLAYLITIWAMTTKPA